MAVARHLEQLKATYCIYHLSEFAAANVFSFSLGTESSLGLLTDNNGRSIDLSSISAVWYRRPGQVKTLPMPEVWVENMVLSETNSVINGILRSLDCLFVNHPGADNEALIKLSQLKAAQNAGFQIPQTIVTNDPDRARAFFEQHQGNIIYKLVSESSNFCFPAYEIPAGVPTLPCRQSDLAHFDQIKFAPHLFQKRVEKIADIRATVVGHKVFGLKIDSQSGRSKLDWRMDYGVPMEKIELPDEVASNCLRLMKQMGLNYAAFDFCLTPQQEFIFLELNCSGQYLWIEEKTDHQISKELALLLAKQRGALVERTPSFC